jgi:hypothetical protein
MSDSTIPKEFLDAVEYECRHLFHPETVLGGHIAAIAVEAVVLAIANGDWKVTA